MSRPPVRLYDTFTRSRQELRPIHDGVVRIYSCGPTVYRYVHVGNLRTFMLPDLLCRSLTYLGFPTHQVMNITDVGHLTMTRSTEARTRCWSPPGWRTSRPRDLRLLHQRVHGRH